MSWFGATDELSINLRRYTIVEDVMMANIALSCGAKGIHAYTLASSAYYGLESGNDPVADLGYSNPSLTQLSSISTNKEMRVGFLRGDPYGIDPADLEAEDLRKPYNSALPNGSEDKTRYDYEYTDVSSDLLSNPLQGLSALYSPTNNFYKSLHALRPMQWITTANTHDNTLLRTMYPADYWDETDPRCSLVNDTLIYSLREDITRRPEVGAVDVSRIGVANHRFFLTDVTGEYVVDANLDIDTRRHETSCFRASSNFTVGFFKYYESDPDAQYYYFVNTRCHTENSGNIVEAADDEIQLVFNSVSSGGGDPYNGTIWKVTDKITGQNLGSFNYGSSFTTQAINFEPGEGRLIEVTIDRAGIQGIINSNTTWSGVVRLDGNVTVDQGVTLTILPGTRILVDGNYMIKVFGHMEAVGTPTERISFYPFTEDPDGTSWKGIVFQGGVKGEASHLDYCDIRDANIGVASVQHQEDLIIRYSTIRNCTYGMYKLYSHSRIKSVIFLGREAAV